MILFDYFSRRCNFIPNREKLKTFIRSYAIRLGNRSDSPWIFYDSSIKEKYGIQDSISLESVEKFKKSMTISLDVNFNNLRLFNFCVFFFSLGNFT